MGGRYVAIWFTHLVPDHMIRRRPELKNVPFVLSAPVRGRMMVIAVSAAAAAQGVSAGMVVADCRAIMPELEVLEHTDGAELQLLTAIGEWCIRFTPVVAIDRPGGLLLDATGCAHLWGGEGRYVDDIVKRLQGFGYHIRLCMADTPGAAWAISRYGKPGSIIGPGEQQHVLLPLPPAALRIDGATVQRMEKLGLRSIGSVIAMPRSALRRRFGPLLLQQLDRAMGVEREVLLPIQPAVPYTERLLCLEPIRTAEGITIAIQQLLTALCKQLESAGLGMRKCVLTCYRIDGNVQQIEIGTVRPTRRAIHLQQLFALKIVTLTPALGFELFVMTAVATEEITVEQSALWDGVAHDDGAIAALLDKIGGKIGADSIRRYVPAAHYWPERSFRQADTFAADPAANWRMNVPRPIHLLSKPELIEVTVPIPDYPPMLFYYKGELHNVKKADGPERIEQEWWLSDGVHRDYYCVEDEHGARFWLFRSGGYGKDDVQWFLHGFFA